MLRNFMLLYFLKGIEELLNVKNPVYNGFFLGLSLQ